LGWEILSDSEVVEDLIMHGGKLPVQILSGKRKKPRQGCERNLTKGLLMGNILFSVAKRVKKEPDKR